jgi:cell wall-associated NlpC family hydrolase
VSTARVRLGVLLRPALVGAALVAVLVPATAAKADPTPSQIASQISSESERLEQVVEQYNKVTEDLKASQAAAAGLAAQLQPLSVQLDEASKIVSQLAVRAYQGGTIAELSAMFAATDPSRVIDQMTTLDQVSRIERTRIASATEAKTRFDAESARLTQVIADQTAQQQALDAQKAEIDANLAKLNELKRQVNVQTQSSGTRYTGPIPAVSGAAGIAVSFAYNAIGTPYVWAGASPSGYDCSGLTMAAWGAAGVSLPHNAAMQWNKLPHISRDALAPGDLVFYSSLGHVGIYVGDGQIIHAPTFGDHVRLASVDVMPPYGYARPG